MKNAHLRFGWLTYVKSTEKTTTSIKLRLDRFIGEVLPDPPRQAKAHFISVIGGDTQIAAVSAAISLGDRFMVEGPGVQPIRVCLERNAQCFKGSVQLAGRKKPLRHLIALSEEFSSSNVSGSSGRTLLASSENGFIWASIAHIYGIPGMPDWADWFAGELETIEKKRVPEIVQKAEWARYPVRDGKMEIIDAINYVSFVRSKVSAHKADKRLVRVLSVYDVANAQFLSRRLLLEKMGYWRYWGNRTNRH